jgi:hypothetical protein
MVHSKDGYKISISPFAIPVDGGVQKTGLTVDQIKALENLGAGLPGLLEGLQGSGKDWTFVVESFYREMLLMVRDLARNKKQMKAANERFKKGNLIWNQAKVT